MLPRSAVILALLAILSTGAKWNTRNFTVEAPTEQLAERMGQWAEYYRKTKAIEWLGREMPPWPQRCPLQIKVTYGSSGGATSFNFLREGYLPINMEVEGKMERIVASVLPHEVTHTVLAHHFGRPVPRWADEGGSVLSEDEQERQQHEGEVRRIVNTRSRLIRLRTLFNMKDYPRDMIVLYAEGYSVTSMLVGKKGRAAFLDFVADGMRGNNWDKALQTHYGFRGIDELEAEWLKSLAKPASRETAIADVRRPVPTTSASRTVVRTTLPPALPILGTPRVSSPLVRGARPDDTRTETPAAEIRIGAPRVIPANPGFAE